MDQFLQASLQQNASDLHFLSGDPPRIRVHGGLKNLMDQKLTVEFAQDAIFEIMDGVAKAPSRSWMQLISPTKYPRFHVFASMHSGT